MKGFKAVIIISFMMLIFSSCTKKNGEETLFIAEQYGLAYAPLQIMKEKQILEALLPNTKIEWVTLSNTTSIREAMLSENVDVGFMGIPPFIIGLDNGMDWKIMSGLSKNPSGLVTYDKNIKTLADFTSADKIALPQPGSIQHILLAMACEKQFGEADRLDHLLVAMKHPDAYQSLESQSTIKAHFASPPYLFDELNNADNHLILSGEEAFGEDFTFIVGVCGREFYNNKKQYEAVNEGLKQAITYMKQNEAEAIALLSTSYSIDELLLKEYLTQEGMIYSQEVEGLERFVDFMLRNEYIKNDYQLDDLIWE